MSNVQSKIWGSTCEISVTPFGELHHIFVKPSSYCSEHEHRFKSNLFYCLKGVMVVKVWKKDGLVDETILKPGDHTSVEPGEIHQFHTPKISDIQDLCPDFKDTDLVEVLEYYYPAGIDKLDIKRRTQGGSLYTK